MSARKSRPEFGASITAGMSLRDQAAALGVPKTELARWRALAAIPDAEFEGRLAVLRKDGRMPSAAGILAMDAPVPARGQVQRALAIYRAMTPQERGEFVSRASAEALEVEALA